MNNQRNNINVVIMMLVFIITPVLAINFKIAEDRYDSYQAQELEKYQQRKKKHTMIIRRHQSLI